MSKRKQSQNQKIHRYLLTHKKGITSLEAYREFGCTRLAARIADIQKIYNIDIHSFFVEVDTADGDKARVKRYFLEA